MAGRWQGDGGAMALTYNPDVFAVRSLGEAKTIILTAEDVGVEARWQQETPHLVALVRAEFPELGAASTVLDYGCGIGRLAKELIAQTGCRVVGVDISPSMRELAVPYVASDRFVAWAPERLDRQPGGFACDLALAVWVLQHCLKPADDIARLKAALRPPQGGLLLVNNKQRCVPTRETFWYDDRIDIRALLGEAGFAEQAGGSLPEFPSPQVAKSTYWASYRRRS